MSGLVGAILARGVVGTAAACEDAMTISLDCEGVFGVGVAGVGAEDSKTALGEDGASDVRTVLPVPNAEVTAACDVGRGRSVGCLTEDDDATGAGGGGGGGNWGAGGLLTAVGCVCGTCSAIIDVVGPVAATEVGGAIGVDIEVEVAAVRTRERVHRLPLTVVIDS